MRQLAEPLSAFFERPFVTEKNERFCKQFLSFVEDSSYHMLHPPENVPEREGHGHTAEHEVGNCETHDEIVPRRPHYGLAQDGVLHIIRTGCSSAH